MRRIFRILLGMTALVALLSLGPASAAELEQPGPEHAKPERNLPTLAAIAIGQLQEHDGGISTLDLRAGLRDGRTRGNFRFYCPEEGYYNGGVRHLSVEDGVIKVAGGGPLIRPDGTRVPVRFTAEFSTATRQATVTVHGRDGHEYIMSGQLDPGLVWAGDPHNLASQDD